MESIKYVIFDFDGTLADTLKFIITISNKFAKKFVNTTITDDKIEFYRGKPAQQIIKEANIPFYRFPFVVARFKREMKKVIHKLQPYDNIPELLEILSKKYKISILTSNNKNNVETFLKTNKLFQRIEFIKSQPKLTKKNKSLKKIMRKYNLLPENIIYIGDETRDIEASHKVGVKIISVTWGFNNKEILSKYSPDFIVDNPKDILQIL